MARPTLAEDAAYRLTKALDKGERIIGGTAAAGAGNNSTKYGNGGT